MLTTKMLATLHKNERERKVVAGHNNETNQLHKSNSLYSYNKVEPLNKKTNTNLTALAFMGIMKHLTIRT